jgi:F-type H+-transporting ATPase subunit b
MTSRRAFRRSLFIAVLAVCLASLAGPVAVWPRGLAAAAEEKPENPTRELIYHVINFAILVGALGFILRKPLEDFLTARSASIRKSLEEGRKALEAAEAQLHAVEEKLQRLEAEVAAFKAAAAHDIKAESARLKQASAEEAARILESARAQIETAVRGAKLDLKAFAAQQAVAQAEGLIRARLGGAERERLVSQFAESLEGKERRA